MLVQGLADACDRGHIKDSLRRRRTQARWFEPMDTAEAGPVEEIADEAAERRFEAAWSQEWENHLVTAAERRVRSAVSPQHYEIYLLHCVKGMQVREVSLRLLVLPGTVRVVSHRVAQRMRQEVQRLERGLV